MRFQKSPVASSIPFDNTNGPFISSNVQDVIEEFEDFDFTAITEAEGFFDATLESTTSTTPVVSTFSPQTQAKSAGDYLVIHSAVVGQSANNRGADHYVEWRPNATGAWIELILIEGYFIQGNVFEARTALAIISLAEGDTAEFRFRFNRTGNSGTARIKNKAIVIWKFTNA